MGGPLAQGLFLSFFCTDLMMMGCGRCGKPRSGFPKTGGRVCASTGLAPSI